MPPRESTTPRLDLASRKEIANAIWQVFALMSTQVGLTFDTDGVTVRINFNDPVDLDGPTLVTGVIKGFHEYDEITMSLR